MPLDSRLVCARRIIGCAWDAPDVSSDGKTYQDTFTGQYLDGTPLFYEVVVFQAERMVEASTLEVTLPEFSTAASACRRN